MVKKPETAAAEAAEVATAAADMAAELEAAKAKIAELEAEKAATEDEQPAPAAVDYFEELVPFEAFYDGDKYKDDIFVSVNGVRYQIKRGQQVMIPRKVYNVLMRSQRQDMKTAAMMQEQQEMAQKLG